MTYRTPGRYFGRLLIAALVAFGGSALILGADSARAANAAVTISGFAYSPQSPTVTVGDTVTWTNNDAVAHTVTSDSGTTLNSGNIATGATYQKTFDTAGTYAYHCAIHPSMMGSVIVQAQSTATATTTATTTTTATATSTATTTATATSTTTPTATATGSATATATATATRTNTPVPPTATAVPPTQGPTQPATAPINVTLTGANEVPPVTTSATGTFRATPGSSSLAFTLTANGTALTAAHIHQGAAGANGPVVAFLFGPNAAGVSSINNSGTITAANLTGPMAGKTWAEFMTELNAGRLYVNVHSVQNPGGEIRGQIPATPGAPRTGTSAATSDGLPLLMIIFLGAGGLLTLGTASAVALRRRQ